ncbi:MAG: diaminopimelate decarboxylase [Patescibacteria group bacterium]
MSNRQSPENAVAPEFLPKDEEPPEYAEYADDFDRKREAIERAAERFETPFHLYDERGIRHTARELREAFAWAPGYRNFFAVKALPNPRILDILREEGMGADASSGPEIELALRAGLRGEDVMFTSNNTPAEEFRRARDAGAVINFDDASFIEYYQEHVGELPELACLRFNPGDAKGGNRIIGEPVEAKYGLTTIQLPGAYAQLRDGGVERFGLHAMVASNELDPEYFAETARIVFEQAHRVQDEVGIEFEFINLGGGFGIPYEPGQRRLDLGETAAMIETQYRFAFGDSGPRIVTEMGRLPTGPHGVLVTEVRHLMEKYREYAGVDATMADLMRPGLYGAYHHVTVLRPGKGGAAGVETRTYDVVGSLCENNDKFAVQRELPELRSGDVLAIHDTGAHGRAMGFNYNGKLRCGEVLLREDGELELIRRAETEDDYFATLDVPES